MPRVTLKRMIVRGFGPYADEAVVDLLPEANVLVAPNESGKSTLAAALAAILYGLPATADPERFGQGRYRHWGQAPRFEGELLLTVDGSDYHLTRQFETHKVSLRRRDGERWRLLIDGVADNPESKKPNPHYRRFLQETIGLENRELFEATFCLAQPLPNEVELDDAVQQLLSGTGNRYSQVSKALEAKIKELTRYYGLALGDKSKGNKDRQLEQVENEICDLEQKIASGRNSADGLQAIQRQLQETKQQLSAVQEQLTRHEALERAWLQWRTERERHSTALHSYQELEQAAMGVRGLAARQAEIDEEISHSFSAFRGHGEELSPRLEEMERIQELIKAAADERDAIENGLQAMNDSLIKLERDQQALPAILSSSSVATDHARLLELTTAEKHWRESCAAWQVQLDRIAAELNQLPDFASLAERPVSVLSELGRWLDECAEVSERWQGRRREIDELEAEMAREYGVLIHASPELVAQAAAFSLRRMELTQAEQEAHYAYERLAEHEDAYQRAEQDFAARFGKPATAAPVLLSLVREKLDWLRTLAQIEGQQSARGAGYRNRPMLIAGGWLLGLGLGGLAAWLLGGPSAWFVAALIALLVGGCSNWLLVRPRAGARSRSAEIHSTLAQLDLGLGELARRDLQELNAARSMLEQMAVLEERRPDSKRLVALRQAWDEAMSELSAWQALVQPLSDAFIDPQKAHGEWQALDQQKQLLNQELRLLAQQLGCDDLAAPDAVGFLLSRPYLGETLRLFSIRVETIEELIGLGRAAPRWPGYQEQALRWEQLQQEKMQIARSLTESMKRGADGLSVGERLSREAASLRQRLAPFTETTPTDQLHDQLKRYGELTQEIEKCRVLISAQAKRLEAKRYQACELDQRWQELLQPIISLWQTCGSELAQLRRRHREYLALVQEEARLKQAQLAALQSRQVDSLMELERMKTDQALNLIAIKTRWQALIDEHPGLPGQEDANHTQTVADQYESLQDELVLLREKLASLRESVDQLRTRQAALQGQQPINIAAADDQLLGLRAQRTQMKREVQALGLAYRELKAAITEYEGSYRQRLADQATAYFRRITGDSSRSVELSSDFGVGLSTADGRSIVPRQLSQGALDQLYISLRLAIADLMADQLTLPMILDDPFVNCDQERLERSRAAIQEISAGRQVLLLTHQAQMGGWGQEVVVKR